MSLKCPEIFAKSLVPLSINLTTLWVHWVQLKRKFRRKCCDMDTSFRSVNDPITVRLNPELNRVTHFLHHIFSNCAKLGFSIVLDTAIMFQLYCSCRVRPCWEVTDETNSFQLFSVAGRSLTETAVSMLLHPTKPICTLALGHAFFPSFKMSFVSAGAISACYFALYIFFHQSMKLLLSRTPWWGFDPKQLLKALFRVEIILYLIRRVQMIVCAPYITAQMNWSNLQQY